MQPEFTLPQPAFASAAPLATIVASAIGILDPSCFASDRQQSSEIER